MKNIVFFLIALTSVALASEGGHGVEEHALSMSEILKHLGPAAFNFILFIGLLVYALKKPITDLFAERINNYRGALKSADAALAEAQAKRAEITNNIKTLQSTRAETVSKAKSDAESMRVAIISEAKASANKFREEAERTIKVEVEKAKVEVRNHLLQQAISAAEKGLREQLDAGEQKRLQKEFVSKI
jgi:F-type H+-transporting ATPase subunit b